MTSRGRLLAMLTLLGALLAAPTALYAGGPPEPSAQPVDRANHLTQVGPRAYAIAEDNSGAQFGVLDIGSGVFQPIAGLSAQGLARDAHRHIYVVDGDNNLVRVTPGNGKAAIVGPTGVTTPGPLGSTLVDVFASLATGELFLMDYDNNLYSVDPNTGTAALIGPTGIPPIVSPFYSSSFAGDCDSLFFTISEVDVNLDVLIPPTLYRIDPSTGVATLVGPTADLITGSAFIDGTLYGFSFDVRFIGGPGPQTFVIDTSSGAATPVSDLNVILVGGATGFSGANSCKGSGSDG